MIACHNVAGVVKNPTRSEKYCNIISRYKIVDEKFEFPFKFDTSKLLLSEKNNKKGLSKIDTCFSK